MKQYQLRLHGLSLSITEAEQEMTLLKEKAAAALGLPPSALLCVKLNRKSLDSRDKQDLRFVYALDVTCTAKAMPKSRKRGITADPIADKPLPQVEQGSEALLHPPVVVGAGPAGLFAALMLAEAGYQPLLIERGPAVPQRAADVEHFWSTGSLNEESNVQFGEGGAGTFSDGKLTFRGKDPLAKLVFDSFIEAGADPEIGYWYKPHIGSDRLQVVIPALRRRIIALGGRIAFNARLTDVTLDSSGAVEAVTVNDALTLPTQALVLALGNGARDSYRMLLQRGFTFAAKPFAVGFRIDHPQALIDAAQHGDFAPLLPAADYQLTWQDKENGRGYYSFCMCPGGHIVNASSQAGMLVVNGVSYAKRDSGRACSAIVGTVNPGRDFADTPEAALAWQEELEQRAYALGGGDYALPVQLAEDFINGVVTDASDARLQGFDPKAAAWRCADLNGLLPDGLNDGLKAALQHWQRVIPQFIGQGVLAGVESRTSAPVRMPRDESGQALAHPGCYPAGEGAGYAGGIVSSAVDGIRAAQALMRRFATPQTDFAEMPPLSD